MNCLAAFAAFFDPHKGNVLEWSRAGENARLLQEVEMLVLGPGFQYSSDEHVVFKLPGKENIYGVASFNLLKTDNEKERFSRMRSVGVLGADVDELRRLVPLLNYISRQLNSRPREYSLLETVSSVLLAPGCSDDSILGLLEQHINTETDGPQVHLSDKNHLVPLVVSDSSFLILWRSVMCRRRVLLYSKIGAGQLCDICLDLRACCGALNPDNKIEGNATRDFHNLMYRTISFEQEIALLSGEGHAWLIATTDASLVTLRPIDWEVLVVLQKQNGAKVDSDKYLVDRNNVTQAISVPTIVDNEPASLTVYFCERSDRRLFAHYKRTKEDLLWRHIHSMPTSNIAIKIDNTADCVKYGMVSWYYRMCQDMTDGIISICTDNDAGSVEKSIQHSTLRDICKEYGVHKSNLQWIIFFCEVIGITVCNDGGCISGFPSMQRSRQNNVVPAQDTKAYKKSSVVPVSK